MTAISPGSIKLLLKTAAEHEAAGRAEAARRLLSDLAQQFASRVDTQEAWLHFLARHGLHSDLLASARALIERVPAQGFAWTLLAWAQLTTGEDAVAAAEQATRLSRDSAAAHEYLGLALRRAGRAADAIASLRRAHKCQPASASIRVNLANALKDAGELGQAIDAYRSVLRLQPTFTLARMNLADALIRRRELDEAAGLLERCLVETPQLAAAHAALGEIARHRNDMAQAVTWLRRAVELDPASAGARFNLASVLADAGDPAAALPVLDAAIALAPANARMRAMRAVLELPAVPLGAPEAESAAPRFAAAVERLADWRRSPEAAHATDTTVSSLPFLLAYRDGNHVDVLARFADTVLEGIAAPAIARASRSKVRVGIVSQHMRRHSVWDMITRGVIESLPPGRAEIVVYHLGHAEDAETAFARGRAGLWRGVAETGTGVDAWAKAIAHDAPDVLFYPEVGMDPLAYALAGMRLAPLQLAGWGHPLTTGLATIDRYLSGALLEPADADAHYREQLVRLPGTGCVTAAPSFEDCEPDAIVLELASRSGPLLLAPGMPFKFAPDDDRTLVDIAQRLGPCTIALGRDAKMPVASDRLLERLSQAFRAAGLDPQAHLAVVPWLPQARFRHLLDRADAVLDCPAFSGYTTAWMSAHCGAPVVTLEGRFMRQRLAAGLLRRAGVPDTIARSRGEYVDLAVGVATEGDSSRRDRRQTLRHAAPSVNGDAEVMQALRAQFLG